MRVKTDRVRERDRQRQTDRHTDRERDREGRSTPTHTAHTISAMPAPQARREEDSRRARENEGGTLPPYTIDRRRREHHLRVLKEEADDLASLKQEDGIRKQNRSREEWL